MDLRRAMHTLVERHPSLGRLRDLSRPTRQRVDNLLRAIGLSGLQRMSYLDWLASSEGPREAYFLRRFRPSRGLLYRLRLRHAFSKHRPACRESEYLFIPPSPTVKVRALRRYAKAFELAIFVETGTYMGETVTAVADLFDRCITIELSHEFWKRASALFADRKNVACLLGDSGILLPEVLLQIDKPALFWLDAHASGGDTINSGRGPIFDELAAIYAHSIKKHVILIDDARGHQVEAIVATAPATHRVAVRNDIIRITPKLG